MYKKEGRPHNSVYVLIAGKVVNQRSVPLSNFSLNGQESAYNPLLHIHAKRWSAYPPQEMIQETKRQHYVPQTYLRKFGFERKKDEFQVFVADKERLNKPFPVNTSKICIQKDLYTLTGETEEEMQAIGWD